MTNSAHTLLRSVPSQLLLIAASAWLCAAACSDTDGDREASSENEWLACALDDECAPARANATCGAEGYCVDPTGVPIEVPSSGGSGGSSGSGGASGSTGTGGAGMIDAGSFDPCADNACGDSCKLCAPGVADCVETDEVKRCDHAGTCTGSPVECTGVGAVLPDCGADTEGTDCSHVATQPTPECCDGSQHLRCSDEACTDSIPGSCLGVLQQVAGSDACGGYQPCEGKACGDSCDLCDPADPSCAQSDALRTCDRDGTCVAGSAECSAPAMCDPFASDTDACGAGEVCCSVGRCGPIVTDQGVCETADPDTGGCAPCACETQPGGCPICNSPDTLIATPHGERAISELREGDLVLSMHRGELIAVPVLATRQVIVTDHAVVRLTLDNGRTIEVSGSHPTAAGQRLDALQPGDGVGALQVLAVELVPYTHDRTYDILPASDSGTYLAAGALLGSTLAAIRMH